MRRLLEMDDPAVHQDWLAFMEEQMAQGKEPLPLRQLRERTGLKWDELYNLVDSWPSYSAVEKRLWVRRLLFRKALQGKQ